MQTRIAVIVPCYEDGPLLEQAVHSIREAEVIEVVVVDDASSGDETQRALDRLEASGITVLRMATNEGVGTARNAGLAITSAPLVFPLDADDLAEPGALAAMADCLDAHPEAVACFGDFAEFGEVDLVRAVPDRLDPFRVAYTNEYPVSSMFRRRVLEQLGGWGTRRQGILSYEDWDLWMSIAERGSICVHLGRNRLAYRRRIHGSRLLHVGKRNHRELYGRLKRRHPDLFGDLRRHRKASDVSNARKLLYPLVYGGRRRFGFEPVVRGWLDRLGIWTLKR